MEAIVEVGPGQGALTRHLTSHPLPLHLIEKDTRFLPLLSSLTPPPRIHWGDALEMDFSLLPPRNIWLVSNLPYNIGTLLTRKFLAHSRFSTMTLMFQREVAEKILNPKMNSLKALMHNYFSCHRLLNVPAGAFTPPPQVRSTVVSFNRLKSPMIPLSELDSYEQFLRKLFGHRRKQMKTVLRRILPGNRGDTILKECGIEGNLRSESLSLNQVLSLYTQSNSSRISSMVS